jgi:SAM-dependent MidA family methyltransferase
LRSDQTQQQENGNYQRFHLKVHNLSSIKFTENETQLPNKGLKDFSKTLALGAQTAISYGNESEQNYLRQAASKTIKHLIKQSIQNNITAK